MKDLFERLNTQHPAERWKGVQVVFRHQERPFPDVLIQRLIELLGDSHDGVRTYARKALEKAGPAILPHLRNMQTQSEDPRQLAQIALLAGNMDSDLLLSMTDHEHAIVKMAILQAMARRPKSHYLPYQLQSLADSNGSVRYHAALGIARQGLTTAPDELIEALESDSVLARGAVIYALGKIGDPKAIDPLIVTLHAAIDDTNVNPAVTAVAGRPMTREEWRRFSASHGPIDLPLITLQTLISIGEPATATLQKLDVSQNPKLSGCVAWVLHEIHEQ